MSEIRYLSQTAANWHQVGQRFASGGEIVSMTRQAVSGDVIGFQVQRSDGTTEIHIAEPDDAFHARCVSQGLIDVSGKTHGTWKIEASA